LIPFTVVRTAAAVLILAAFAVCLHPADVEANEGAANTGRKISQKGPSTEKPCHTLLTPRQFQWVREKNFPGLEFAYLQGNPTKPGPYTMQVRIPANSTLPPHTHPQDEVGTVLRGTFYTGAGTKVDKSKGTALPAGSIGIIPKGCIHFAWTKEPILIQVHGSGPWEMQLVDEQGKAKGAPLRLSGPKP